MSHDPQTTTTAVGQATVRRMTQFPGPLLRTNAKPAPSKRARLPLYSLIRSFDPVATA